MCVCPAAKQPANRAGRAATFHVWQILASGDDCGLINVWKLGGGGDGLVHLKAVDGHKDAAGGAAVTTLSLWNKVQRGTERRNGGSVTLPFTANIFLSGVIIAGFGNGYIRLFSVPDGEVIIT